MAKKNVIPLTKETRQGAMDTYQLSTPYGTVTVSEGGRRVTFDLYSDVRESQHSIALFGYVQALQKMGVTRFNSDHVRIVGRDRSLSLTRGKAKLDLVYEFKGKLHECELKTSREIGLDVTARQLVELTQHVENLILLVPRGCLEDASNVIKLINLDHRITLEPYDGWGEEGD